jgi:DNA-binding response OmpR family regulator
MRILIIEDEIKIAKALQKGFQSEGFAVDTVFEGKEGLSKSHSKDYDVIVLDLMLPEVDGLTILRKMRENKVLTPVIILTAKDMTEDKIKGLNLGADDYMAKPFAFDELLARVHALIRRNSSKENILQIDDLILNPLSKMVTRNEKKIDLTAKEFSILEYLMRHKNSIISENQLVSHIWDYDFEWMSNVVAVHIKNLRNKIDKSFPEKKQLLRTVRGLGYKINE